MWFFQSPRIVHGEEALTWLAQLNGSRAFLVTDATILHLGFAQKAVDLLQQAAIPTQVFSEVEPDPSLETVERCAEAMGAWQPDLVIVLGGGSCLDAGKAAWFRYERPDIPLQEINPFENFGLRRKAKLITISTTSGTGADVSWGFALADHQNHAKLVRVSPELVPDMAIVDPSLPASAPPQVTADAGMDILAHAVEAFTNTFSNDYSDGLALHAVRLVFRYLPRAYRDGNDLEARQRLHNAATMAGLAFSNTAITLGHALAHAIAGVFHTPHGRTVGLFLPYTIEFGCRGEGTRFRELVSGAGLSAGPAILADEVQAGNFLARAVRSLLRELQQPLSLAALGISAADVERNLEQLTGNVMGSPELAATLRVPYGAELEDIFRFAQLGRAIDY